MNNLSETQDVFPPYFKMNWDGRKIKSVTAVLRSQHRKPIGLLCINLDISKWEEMHHFILDLIKPATEIPEFWKKYEFTAPYLLCCSDAESWKLNELVYKNREI